jgi:hypothetical protein
VLTSMTTGRRSETPEIDGIPRRRLDRANSATSRRGHDSSSRDVGSPGVRLRKREKAEV